MAMVEFVERNGGKMLVRANEIDEAVQVMVDVTSGTLSEEGFVGWVRLHLDPYASMPNADFEALVERDGFAVAHVVCSACGGSGSDVDGTQCVECRGDGEMVMPNVAILNHALAIRGMGEMDPADVAASLNLVSLFGAKWREELADAIPSDAPPAVVWMAILAAMADSPAEAAKAVDRWWHGT